MKNVYRIITLFLAIHFSVLSAASAETINLSNLSYNELLELRQQVDFAIAQTREWKQVIVSPGEYIVGIDIPAGSYTVDLCGSLANIEVYSDGKRIHGHCLTKSDRVGKLPLQDGQIVRIEYGDMLFTPYKGLGF